MLFRYAGFAIAILAFSSTQAFATTIWSEDFESVASFSKDANNQIYFTSEYAAGQWVAPATADTNGARIADRANDSNLEMQVRGYPFDPNKGKSQCSTILLDEALFTTGAGDVVLLFGALTTDYATRSVTIDNVSVTYKTGNAVPYFTADQPFVGLNANAGVTYSGSIAGAYDAESDSLTYSKVSGPDWLIVAANGDLSGTPTTADQSSINYFSVGVSDASGSGEVVEAQFKVTVYEQDDLDFDSMDDNWEVTYFGSAGAVDGSGNADGDAHTDLEEFIVGTSPIDGTSYFIPTVGNLVSDTSVDVSFNGIAGRTYILQTRASLTSGSWTTAEILGPLGADGAQTITHTITTEEKLFLRVRAVYP